MKMISIDDIIEICDTNILLLKARGQGVAVAALRRVKDVAKEYAVDVELVKHGKWIFKNGYLGNTYYCSECEKAVYLNKYGEPNLTDFCPDCGARMDGGEEDEEQQNKEGGV